MQTQPRKEDWAITNLHNQGVSTFFPRLRKIRRHARRIDTVLAPMFPSYLFVRLELDHGRWRALNGTRGVVRLVAFGEVPRPVPAAIIDCLKASVDADDVFSFNLNQRFQVGDEVRLMVGPFAEQIGRIDCLEGRDRVQVLLDLMGRLVRVSTSVRDIMPERRAS